MSKLFISEIYECLQGEGVLVGTPSIMIRTSSCNLKCKWGDSECDTPFTSWRPEGSMIDVSQVMKEVTRLSPFRHVIISGGEPTLQRGLPYLCSALMEAGYHITVETNGTTLLDDKLLEVVSLWSISPKLASSTPYGTPHALSHAQDRINTFILQKLTRQGRAAYLKFVIVDENDLVEVRHILEELDRPESRVVRAPIPVYLMAEGKNRTALAERAPIVAALALKHNFRYSPRLHVDLYGEKRRT